MSELKTLGELRRAPDKSRGELQTSLALPYSNEVPTMFGAKLQMMQTCVTSI